MGKNIKGRELGKGLSQRKDGRYSARFVNRMGDRKEKYFDTISEARDWLEKARYADIHDSVYMPFENAADAVLDDEYDSR